MAIYGNEGGDVVTIAASGLAHGNIRYHGLLMYTVGEDALRAAADDVTAALQDGALPVGTDAGLPLSWFPLEDAAGAHEAVRNGAVGKVLISLTWSGTD